MCRHPAVILWPPACVGGYEAPPLLHLNQRHDFVMQFGGSKVEVTEVADAGRFVERIGCMELDYSHFNGSTGFVPIGTRRNGNEGLIVNRAIHIYSSANAHFLSSAGGPKFLATAVRQSCRNNLISRTVKTLKSVKMNFPP